MTKPTVPTPTQAGAKPAPSLHKRSRLESRILSWCKEENLPIAPAKGELPGYFLTHPAGKTSIYVRPDPKKKDAVKMHVTFCILPQVRDALEHSPAEKFRDFEMEIHQLLCLQNLDYALKAGKGKDRHCLTLHDTLYEDGANKHDFVHTLRRLVQTSWLAMALYSKYFGQPVPTGEAPPMVPPPAAAKAPRGPDMYA